MKFANQKKSLNPKTTTSNNQAISTEESRQTCQRRPLKSEEETISMYQQHQHHHHLPPGQSGAYYSSPDSAAATTASQAQLHQSYLIHPNHHYHHYPLSSDSSLNESSSFIASSAQRLNSMFQKCCCSKKCIFISCLMLILMIFIFVIGLSAYLNFLINLNKTNLIPLSGRLKVNSEGDLFNDLLANKTTKEFLHKQLQYETILRGALDKSLMRTYPLHLIKLEVYSFKPGSLWCYFRLFLNKKSLMQDLQLMKRKSLDENMDKLFLPRLTQQTLHSGFEQLLTDFSGAARSTSGDRPESLRRNQRASAPQQAQPTAQQQNAKSFDDQISRLMPIIENIDLSTIQVTAEFDMLAMINSQAAMSENLRALQPILATTTTPSPSSTATIMVATGPKMSDFDLLQPSSQPDSVKPAKQPPAIELSSSGSASDEISVSTKRFTLHDYRENATRPPTSAKPTTTNQESLFLLNQQQKKPALSSQKPQSSQTLKELASAPSKSGSDVESGEKVIKLVSGQPVVSQNPNIFASSQPANVTSNQNAGQSSPARNITTLFAPLTKLDQLANRPKSVNESAAIMQMVAPYQKIEYSSVMVPQQQQSVQRANETQASQRLQKSSNTSAASIQELWNNALGKKNATVIMPNDQRPSGQLADSANNNKRLITVTTIGQPSANNNNDQSTNLQKVSLLSSDISSTIRAQMQQANANVAATTQPTPTTTGSSPKPKVSPHLRQGGSIISTNNNPARNSAPEQPTSTTSAIVLNRDRDFLQLANKNINQGQDNNNSTSSQQQATRKLSTASAQPNRSASSSTSAKQTPNNKKVSLQRNGNNSTSTDKPRNSNKQQVAKQQQNKLDQQRQQSSIVANDQSVRSSNQTNGIGNNQNGTLINSKGIRIVDDFLAHIDPKLLLLASSNRTNLSSSRGKNRTQEPFNFNADQMLIPTLPTTIELTRQTTASLPLRSSTPSFVSNLDFTTTTPSSSQPSTTTELPFQVAELPVSILGQTNKPGTSNFSNQWRPLSRDNNNGSSTANRAKPANSLSIILGSERLPATLNNPSSQLGSRSPFAMSTSILENPQLMGNKPAAASRTANSQRQTGSQRLSNTYHVSNSASAAAAGQRSNEFESRRVSRMRQNNGPANHESDLNQSSLESSSSSSTFATTSSSTVVATSGATSSSSLFSSTPSSAEPTTNTRFVDDFMITTDRSLANGLNPTTASLDSSAEIDPALARLRSSALSFVSQPRRTRGPFVFETLKSQAADNPFAELATTISGGASRLERSSSVQPEVDSKLLIRKKLFVGDDSGDALAPSATTSNPLIEPLPGMMHAEEEISLDDKQLDHFGNRRSFLARHRVNETAAAAAPGNRCQYYGCKAKGLINFVCLNYTQLCDDIIDCQDESDELDCVSLLQHDFNTNKLSFSNGGGIIYLNRKGSLAPMCIDYFGTTTVLSSSLSPPAQMIAPQNQDMNLNLIKKQQELIRQINTIGQYACSLQSFSRLVSVKINHHNLIDPMNLIKSSRLYHRLSIIDGMEKQHDQG